MRIIKKLAVFSIASLITFGLGVTLQRCVSTATRYFSEPSAWQVLLSFENQDLAGLDEQSMRVVKRAIDTATAPVAPTSVYFLPRLFRKISNSNDERRYILVEENPLQTFPGKATVRVHIFDTAGRVLSSTQFHTGNRMEIIAMRIGSDYEMNKDALIIDTEFWTREHSSHQVYTVVDNELRLAYLGALFGVDTNNYEASWCTIGPRLSLSADEWERELQSTDDARILSALTWLGGHHWYGPEASNDEDRLDGQRVKDLLARESVRRRLADLTNSSNFFVEHAAKAILKDK